MDFIFQYIDKLGQIGWTLAFIYIGALHLIEKGYLRIGKNGNGVSSKVDKLSTYYNHDLTEHLSHLSQGVESLRVSQEKENAAHEAILRSTENIGSKLDKILQDGVRVKS